MHSTCRIQHQKKVHLIKREWWRPWEDEELPPLEHVIQSYDTAFMKKQTADYSAITTWGVFRPSEDDPPNLILVDAVKADTSFQNFVESRSNNTATGIQKQSSLNLKHLDCH